jgi:EAL domain-containing protein (putative c-di-GMP-specific phosphodiesterase class I)
MPNFVRSIVALLAGVSLSTVVAAIAEAESRVALSAAGCDARTLARDRNAVKTYIWP